MNLTNKLSLLRIILIPVTLLFMLPISIYGVEPTSWNSFIATNGMLIAAIIFIIASLTDMLDGKIARSRNMITDLGKFLDPIADKMLVDGILIYLLGRTFDTPHANLSSIAVYCVIIMIIRDLIVDAIRLMAAKKKEVIAANIFGKAKTVLQMVAIPALLLNDWPFSYFDSSWPIIVKPSNILLYAATLMSLISGVIYFVQNKHVLKEGKKDAE